LLREKDMTAGEIAEQFDISKPSISHHLDTLKRAKLVVCIKKGQFQVYSLNTTVMDGIIQWLMSIKNK